MANLVSAAEEEKCPKCSTAMRPAQAPFKVTGKIVGHYDAMKCPSCSYFYFTEKDYDRIMLDAKAIKDATRSRLTSTNSLVLPRTSVFLTEYAWAAGTPNLTPPRLILTRDVVT